MMSLWDALRMNMMISYQELVRTFPNACLIKEIVFTLFIIFQNYRTEFYLCLKWLSLGCI
ncbi:Uncharacterised protein [Klebsiella pneumoniae]|nr:Uncharacterised protein [Klebsiella pneumoniae]HBX1440861.1 hypothetical protein [Klebsiella pneumoniae]